MSFTGNEILDKLPKDSRVTLTGEAELLHFVVQLLYERWEPQKNDVEIMLRMVKKELQKLLIVNSKIEILTDFLLVREVMGQVYARYPQPIAEMFETRVRELLGSEGAHLTAPQVDLEQVVQAMDATIPAGPEADREPKRIGVCRD